MSVSIRRARVDDVSAVTHFLTQHWRADHVFARRPSLFTWQHQDGADLNAVLAHEDGEIIGLLGYIPMRHFDPSLKLRAVALAVWRALEGRGAPGVGLQMLNHLRRTLDPHLIFAVGLSDAVVPLYRALRFTTGVMNHHVLRNPSVAQPVLAPGLAGLPTPALSRDCRLLAEWQTGDDLPGALEPTARANVPEKSLRYLQGRYLDHPEYRYRVLALGRSLDAATLVVVRSVTAHGASALRIVDVVGPTGPLAGAGAALVELVDRAECEHLDVEHVGISAEHLTAAGFTDRRSVQGLVVPGHFEPFEPRGADLDYAFKTYPAAGPAATAATFRLMRGDSDQDRPNL